MYYHGKELIDKLIRDRANERRARRNERRTNMDAWTGWVPFDQWLLYAKGVEDWHSLKPYRLYDWYNEYQLECLRNGLEYQAPTTYGLYNTLFD